MQGVGNRPTKYGIREALMAQGYVPGTTEYENMWQAAYIKMFPEDRKLAVKKHNDSRGPEYYREWRRKRAAAKAAQYQDPPPSYL